MSAPASGGGVRSAAPLASAPAAAPQSAPGQAVAAAPNPQPSPAPEAAGPPVSGRNTPRVLGRLRIAVLVTSLALAILSVVGTVVASSALSGAALDIDEGQRLRTAQAELARAQSYAVEAADPRVKADPTLFRSQIDSVYSSLVATAAVNPDDASMLTAVAADVSTYRAAVEAGLALRTTTESTKAQMAVDAANTTLNGSAVKQVGALIARADARLPGRFSSVFTPVLLGVGALAVLAAAASAVVLALRTRRVINLGVTVALIALLIATGLAWSGASAAAATTSAAQGFVLSSARSAVEVQALAERGRVAQLRGSSDGQVWSFLAEEITTRVTGIGWPSVTTAWSGVEAAVAKGDLAGTRTAIDALATATREVADASTPAVRAGGSVDAALGYGVGAAVLSLLAALLGWWGLTTRLNEYRS